MERLKTRLGSPTYKWEVERGKKEKKFGFKIPTKTYKWEVGKEKKNEIWIQNPQLNIKMESWEGEKPLKPSLQIWILGFLGRI